MRSIHGKQNRTHGIRPSRVLRSPMRPSLKQRPAPVMVQLSAASPRPGLSLDLQGHASSRKARKLPGRATSPRPLFTKPGKATQRIQVAKRGGNAKPAKHGLLKLAALPTPIPGRRTLGTKPVRTARPAPVRAAARVVLPLPAAAQVSSAASGPASTPGESPGEDDAPGIDAAGGPAGGGQRHPASTAAPQATDTSPTHASASHRGWPAAHSPDPSPSSRAHARAREGARGRLGVFTYTGGSPTVADRPSNARTLRSREQA